MSVTVSDLKKVFATVLPSATLDTMDPAKPLVGQGVDSLSLTALAVALEKTYKVRISVEDGIKLKTLNDVAAYLNKVQK